jgi:hypothetical protein
LQFHGLRLASIEIVSNTAVRIGYAARGQSVWLVSRRDEL